MVLGGQMFLQMGGPPKCHVTNSAMVPLLLFGLGHTPPRPKGIKGWLKRLPLGDLGLLVFVALRSQVLAQQPWLAERVIADLASVFARGPGLCDGSLVLLCNCLLVAGSRSALALQPPRVNTSLPLRSQLLEQLSGTLVP